MIKKILFLLATIFTGTIAVSQTPCSSGMAGDYPCKDYDLMSIVSLGDMSTTFVNDSWGWTDPTNNKEYAIIGLNNGTAFVDITDALNPKYLGKLPTATLNSTWRDVKVHKDHAYIVSEAAGHGMQVFDLKRLRTVTTAQTFTADKHFTGFGSAHNIVINENSDYAYPVGTSKSGTYKGGPLFINISDPKNPVSEGGWGTDNYSHDAQVITYTGPDTRYTNKEILIGSNENEVVVVDITDKSKPETISKISYANVGYTHQGWFTEDQKYFILGDELDEQNFGMKTRSIIFDFTNLKTPKEHFVYLGPTDAIDHNGYVKGDTFYLANYTAGVRFIDISNIGTKSITETGYFDTYPESNTASFNGVWSVYPYFASGNIVISDSNRGLFVVRKSGTLSVDKFSLSKKFSIAPNPTKNNPTIRAKENAQIVSLQVFSILGRKVFAKQNINKKEYVLPISSFSKGIYLVKINNKITKKLVVK
mgnify:CR=1 FL=1